MSEASQPNRIAETPRVLKCVDRRTLLLIVGIILTLATVIGLAFPLSSLLAPRPPASVREFLDDLALNQISVQVSAALALPAFWAADRLRLGRASAGRAILLHLPIGTSYVLLHATVVGWLLWRFGLLWEDESAWGAVVWHFRFTADSQVTYYIMIATSYHLLAHLVRRWQLQLDLSRRENELAAARLDALNMELQPHFLFNTLNTLSAYVASADTEAAGQVIERLSRLLRHVLRRATKPRVPLADEIRFALDYLELHRLRFGSRLRVKADAEAGAGDILVPTLCLQPLVENAIKHGFGGAASEGEVVIAARIVDEQLVLEVTDRSDNGRVRADSPASDEPLRSTGGRGLTNVRERIQRLHGPGADVELIIEPEQTVARVSLPLRDGEQHAADSPGFDP